MAFQNRDRGHRDFNRAPRGEMFDAVCAKCGNACQVPFQPNGKKDVLCSNCFKENRGDDNNFHERRDFRDNRNFRERRPFPPRNSINLDEVNSKLDKILALLENTNQ